MSIPIDTRAILTLNQIIYPFLNSLNLSQDKRGINHSIITYLPYGLAASLELFVAVHTRKENLSLIQIKEYVRGQLINLIQKSINLPAYSRADVIDWYNSDPTYIRYFNPPEPETITITLYYANRTSSESFSLTEEEILGIAYGLKATKHMTTVIPEVITSLTQKEIEVDRLVENTINRKISPYQVTVKLASSINIKFQTPGFIRGLISVAIWYKLPADALFSNLMEQTSEGYVPIYI